MSGVLGTTKCTCAKNDKNYNPKLNSKANIFPRVTLLTVYTELHTSKFQLSFKLSLTVYVVRSHLLVALAYLAGCYIDIQSCLTPIAKTTSYVCTYIFYISINSMYIILHVTLTMLIQVTCYIDMLHVYVKLWVASPSCQ